MKNSKRLIIFALILLIAVGLLLLNSLLKPKEEAVKMEPSLPPNIELSASKVDIKGNAFPIWLNEKEIIYQSLREIVSLNVETLKTKSLIKLDNELKSLTAKNGVIFVEIGLPFTDIKNYQIYKDGKISSIDLKNQEPVVLFSLSLNGSKLYFVGSFDANKNSGNLYSYDIDMKQVSQSLYNNFPFSTLQWIDNSRALVYKFSDKEGGETLSLFDLNKKSLNLITSSISSLSLISISPDKSKILISGEGNLILKDIDNLSQTLNLKDQSYYGAWIDNVNILISLKDSPASFVVFNINEKTERNIDAPIQLKDKTIRSVIPSTDNKYLLVRTQDNLWFVIQIN